MQRKKFQTKSRYYCKRLIDGRITSWTELDRANSIYELQRNATDREDTPTYPAYSLGYFDIYEEEPDNFDNIQLIGYIDSVDVQYLRHHRRINRELNEQNWDRIDIGDYWALNILFGEQPYEEEKEQ
ncbi:uncharacterized protein LOC120358579 [Solenopsis invicta]|uniref:uncharacterized protein LOC120358579 n=1 Tax=Solenopsis invicta TaxID=13686 RepID=UPI00193DEAE5|nr:uncharacterized protein LOC120358579 [Solenopsis invicta]